LYLIVTLAFPASYAFICPRQDLQAVDCKLPASRGRLGHGDSGPDTGRARWNFSERRQPDRDRADRPCPIYPNQGRSQAPWAAPTALWPQISMGYGSPRAAPLLFGLAALRHAKASSTSSRNNAALVGTPRLSATRRSGPRPLPRRDVRPRSDQKVLKALQVGFCGGYLPRWFTDQEIRRVHHTRRQFLSPS
jgi:hypothetical protein